MNQRACYLFHTMHAIYAWLIPAIWLAWALYWCVAAFAAKPVRRKESIVSRLSHGVPLTLAILLLTSSRFAGAILDTRFLPSSALLFWIGTALLLAGLFFAIAARLHLGGNWSGTVTLKQDHTLTRSGPYRFHTGCCRLSGPEARLHFRPPDTSAPSCGMKARPRAKAC